MVVVTKKKGESKDSIFRKFTKVFIEEDIIGELKKKQFYRKPSLVRKEEEREKLRKKLPKSFKPITIIKKEEYED